MINYFAYSACMARRGVRQGPADLLHVGWIYNAREVTKIRVTGSSGQWNGANGENARRIRWYRAPPPTLRKIYDRLSDENFYSSSDTRRIILCYQATCLAYEIRLVASNILNKALSFSLFFSLPFCSSPVFPIFQTFLQNCMVYTYRVLSLLIICKASGL